MTFEEWYEAIGRARSTTSPRDLARAAFHAGAACLRTDLEFALGEQAEQMKTPVISAELHVGLREHPRAALRAWSRGLIRNVARAVGQRGVGGG